MAFDIKGTDVGTLLLRIGLGVVFVVHGLGKLDVGPLANGAGVPGVVGFLAQLGVPFPTAMAWIVTVVETAGGILLWIGLFVRIASFLLGVDMLVATVLFHLPNGFAISNGGVEFTFALLSGTLALVFLGPGRLSVERLLFGRELLVPSRQSSTSYRRV